MFILSCLDVILVKLILLLLGNMLPWQLSSDENFDQVVVQWIPTVVWFVRQMELLPSLVHTMGAVSSRSRGSTTVFHSSLANLLQNSPPTWSFSSSRRRASISLWYIYIQETIIDFTLQSTGRCIADLISQVSAVKCVGRKSNDYLHHSIRWTPQCCSSCTPEHPGIVSVKWKSSSWRKMEVWIL